jgi:hypothetical protein
VINTEKNSTLKGSKKIWEYPWKYAESFLIALEILCIGIIIEFVSRGRGMIFPGLPTNIYIILIYTVILLAIHLKYKESPGVKWISSIPAAISSITIYAVLVLLLGFIPQGDSESSKFLAYTGLSHVKNSWPFILIQFYVLTSLGMVALKRAIPFKVKNIGFLLNHFGLWLTLLAAGLGSADLKRLSINLYENKESTSIAVSQQGVAYRLPFSVKLLDFDVVQYNPKLAIVNIETNKYYMGKTKSLPFIDKNTETTLADWQIKTIEYIPQALSSGGKIYVSDSVGSFPAALVLVKNLSTGDTIRGWISSGSYIANPDYLVIDKSYALILTKPEPKKYSSNIIVYENASKSDTFALEVNKPVSIKGWDLYQIGFDEEQGKWSTLSVVEAVRDPWLPIVYFGIALLLSGALYMFWIGKDKKEKTI